MFGRALLIPVACLVCELAVHGEPPTVAEALHKLNSKEDETRDTGIAYLKEHYAEAKSAMLKALDCDKGTFSDVLAYTFARVGKAAVPDLVAAFPQATKRQKVNL